MVQLLSCLYVHLTLVRAAQSPGSFLAARRSSEPKAPVSLSVTAAQCCPVSSELMGGSCSLHGMAECEAKLSHGRGFRVITRLCFCRLCKPKMPRASGQLIV